LPSWSSFELVVFPDFSRKHAFLMPILLQFQSQLILAAISSPLANLNDLIDEATALMSDGVTFGSRESLKKSATGEIGKLKENMA
jgi:hypothetical protein